MTAIMQHRTAHLTGSPVAECPDCGTVCVYWDAEDLDDEGNLWCYCEGIPSPMAGRD